ncbi:hypothetical protein [Actinokineospora sp. NBRC 105648]|uniref:hypothetical protein n=1 Tax=Actinokineospora sp. NBRC 105648 TaxID=3032206 RepID=UPI0024A1E4B9|nr:hypothetical protein [Actinokineospora sp. NBRC 105648]GLZ42653.1 hypothetical protein Acsp05_62770 [Actinokineospora sp. NBRC 105648]
MPVRPSLLLVTDLSYPARGRRYGDEDVYLSGRLRTSFDVALCHPLDAAALLTGFDVVMTRNSGPVLHYQEAYSAFRATAEKSGIVVYNPLGGRGDQAGKQYLVDLTVAGYPVIPTVDRAEDIALLPEAELYAVKPKAGADSVGLAFVPRADLVVDGDILVQPRIDFQYEVSFYYVDHEFQYALYAPDPERRWELKPYDADAADLAFAQRFVEWNTLAHGIQRVDACRTGEGELLLVELEDLNPYLSLDLAPEQARDSFINAVITSIQSMLDA